MNKQELLDIGFTETKNPIFLELKKDGFYIELSLDGYFFIYTDKSGDREGAPYDYKGIEKLKALIKAHEDYFL